jgi:hypothetical protein
MREPLLRNGGLERSLTEAPMLPALVPEGIARGSRPRDGGLEQFLTVVPMLPALVPEGIARGSRSRDGGFE